MTVGALGVVFGDIGTSPLYALRECFDGHHAIPPTPANVLGVLSLVFWALVLDGLGQVPRLSSCGPTTAERAESSPSWRSCGRRRRRHGSRHSVLDRPRALRRGAPLRRRHHHAGDLGPHRGRGARGRDARVQALRPADHHRHPRSPSSSSRRTGPAGIGAVFGPVMVVWFAVLAILGLVHDLRRAAGPRRRQPAPRVPLLRAQRDHGFLVLGLGLPRRDGRRGPLRGHGALRRDGRSASPGSSSSCRPSSSTTSGRARCSSPTPRPPQQSVLSASLPTWALFPLVAPRDGGHRHRVPGPHLRRVLAHPAGDPARLLPAPADRPHVGEGDRADLRPVDQLGARCSRASRSSSLFRIVRAPSPRPTASP